MPTGLPASPAGTSAGARALGYPGIQGVRGPAGLRRTATRCSALLILHFGAAVGNLFTCARCVRVAMRVRRRGPVRPAPAPHPMGLFRRRRAWWSRPPGRRVEEIQLPGLIRPLWAGRSVSVFRGCRSVRRRHARPRGSERSGNRQVTASPEVVIAAMKTYRLGTRKTETRCPRSSSWSERAARTR